MTTPFTVFSGATSALTNALLAPNSGISVSNIALNASASDAVNLYDGSLLPLGIGAGLLLTSGTTPGTINTSTSFGQDNTVYDSITGIAINYDNGDADINAVVNTVFQTQSYDATTLAFDFTVSDQNATSVTFDLVMGSDEYPEWVDAFVDSAVVIVNGVNYALFNHNAYNPLSVLSQNLAAGYFQDNANNVLPIEYDGVSQVLKIVAPINAGITNHIKIGIADTGDHVLDTGILIANLSAGTTPGSGVVATQPDTSTVGNDTVTGSVKDEYLDLQAGDDIAYAGAGDDIVVAGAGNDTVYAGTGNDEIKGDAGDDSIDGGDGIDTAVYAGSKSDYQFSYDSVTGLETISNLADGIDTLQNVENIKFKDGTFELVNGNLSLLTASTVPTPPSNTPGMIFMTGIAMTGQTLTVNVSDVDGINGSVSCIWQSNGQNIPDAVSNTYVISDADIGSNITAIATYVDNKGNSETLLSNPKSIIAANNGDFSISLLNMTAPIGASVVNPLTTLVQNAIDLGVQPTEANIIVKNVLGIASSVNLQHYDSLFVLNNPTAFTATELKLALAVEKIAVEVGMTTSLGGDENGIGLTEAILNSYENGTPLNLKDEATIANILGLNSTNAVTHEIVDRNKNISEDAKNIADIDSQWAQAQGSLTGNGLISQSISDFSVHINQAPIGSTDVVLQSGLVNQDYYIQVSDLLSGFSDPDLEALNVNNVNLNPAVGTVIANDGMTITIGLTPDYTGPVEFTYDVVDPQSASISATQMFVINSPNQAPTVTLENTTVSADENTSIAPALKVADITIVDDGQGTNVVGLTGADAAKFEIVNNALYLKTGTVLNYEVKNQYDVNVDVSDDALGVTLSNPYTLLVNDVNEAPVITGISVASATEDGVVTSIDALKNASDEDKNSILSILNVATLPAGITYDSNTHNFSLNPANSAFQALEKGEKFAVTVGYSVTDDTFVAPTSATFNVVGVNDAPTVSAALSASVIEGDAVVSLAALSNANDVDHNATLSVVNVPTTLPAGVTYNATTKSFSFDPTNSAYTSLTAGQVSNVTIGYGISDGLATTSDSVIFKITGIDTVIVTPPTNTTINGTAGNDSITGTSANDSISSGAGNDTIDGGLGADTMIGGIGDDLYIVDKSKDVVTESSNQGTDTVQSSITYELKSSNVENLTLTGTNALDAVGNDANNVITGNSGKNQLEGGSGNDTLIGGLGTDSLSGGAGSDLFKFNVLSDSSVGTGRDVIKDFVAGGDKVDLSAIDANTKVSGNDAFTATIVASFTKVPGQLCFVPATSSTTQAILSGDTNGDGVADFEIAMTGVLTLTSASIVL